jgi:acylphosphatase
MTEQRIYRVEGRVQGVWFRASTREQAESLGITGHAINLADGDVEVLACGPAAALEALYEWLHEGPELAKVGRVESRSWSGPHPADFTIG